MERLEQRLQLAQQALNTLEKALVMPLTDIVRDAAIQRFEFSFEAVWKLAQLYLREHDALDLNSPKSVIRAYFQVGLLQEQQTILALQMGNDSNLTVHLYNEKLAQEIFSRLPQYCQLMQELLSAITRNLPVK